MFVNVPISFKYNIVYIPLVLELDNMSIKDNAIFVFNGFNCQYVHEFNSYNDILYFIDGMHKTFYIEKQSYIETVK